MWGRATLITVTSRTCITVTVMTVTVMAQRRRALSGASRSGVWRASAVVVVIRGRYENIRGRFRRAISISPILPERSGEVNSRVSFEISGGLWHDRPACRALSRGRRCARGSAASVDDVTPTTLPLGRLVHPRPCGLPHPHRPPLPLALRTPGAIDGLDLRDDGLRGSHGEPRLCPHSRGPAHHAPRSPMDTAHRVHCRAPRLRGGRPSPPRRVGLRRGALPSQHPDLRPPRAEDRHGPRLLLRRRARHRGLAGPWGLEAHDERLAEPGRPLSCRRLP